VELEGVWFSYGRVPVLEDVHLTVRRGAFLGVIGPNGAGKTTLLKLVLGLLEPDRGRVRVLGGSPSAARGRVGYVPQFARFDPEFPVRVRDVVLMGRLGDARPLLGHGDEARASARRALEWMELEELGDRHVGELSGGQLQRTLIARALAMEPEVLLLDEPTASVDTRIGGNLYGMLEELSEHMTVILVSHDVGVISREVESVACLNRRLWYHGSEDVTPEVLEAAYGGRVEMVTHGEGHRILRDHGEEEG
jgi:zinc transport system ATP-binding protein